MTRRAVRLFLLATLTLALGSAAWRIFRLEQALGERRAAADAFDRSASRLLDALLDHRASERALVAPGQGAPYWTSRAVAAREVIDQEARALRLTAVPVVAPAVDRLGEALTEFRRVSGRIHKHALAARMGHAGDLIFADAVQASGAVEREARAVREAMRADARASEGLVRGQEAVVIGLAVGAALLVALALVPVPGRPPDEPASDTRLTPLDVVDHTPRPVAAAPATPQPALLPPRAGERAASPAALQAAADVCAGLARVQDSRELPALVDRISAVVDARGTILWIADEQGQSLRPTLAHGYASTALGRLGAIAIEGDTPAAHAYRRAEPRTVAAVGDASAALVIPVVSASGPVGVLTLEVAPGCERQAATLAMARIFAAQLAGLIAPSVSEPTATAAK
jgi:hypothetical protein